jgi:hypothetical protein
MIGKLGWVQNLYSVTQMSTITDHLELFVVILKEPKMMLEELQQCCFSRLTIGIRMQQILAEG